MSRISTEGCKCSPRQAKWLTKNLFSVCYKKLPLKYYTMIKRLILLAKIKPMIDFKKIKQTENPPAGIAVMKSGGMAICLDEIMSYVLKEESICIYYRDGTHVEWYPIIKQDDQL